MKGLTFLRSRAPIVVYNIIFMLMAPCKEDGRSERCFGSFTFIFYLFLPKLVNLDSKNILDLTCRSIDFVPNREGILVWPHTGIASPYEKEFEVRIAIGRVHVLCVDEGQGLRAGRVRKRPVQITKVVEKVLVILDDPICYYGDSIVYKEG